MRYLYVMVSRTDTGFARLIRRFTGCYYNHAAISFDCDLRQLYSFARRAYDLPLTEACLNARPVCRMSPGSILPIPIAERGIIPCLIKWRIWSRRASSPSIPPGSG